MSSLVIRFNTLLFACITSVTAMLSCNVNTAPPAATHADTAATYAHAHPSDSTALKPEGGDNAILYFAIADTGQSYAILDKAMYTLGRKLGWPVDTMNRYYNSTKDLIAVADNDEDEMYRGEYYPRRFPSQHLSLEYYITYIPASTPKNIALVAGIYETQKSADSLLALLKPTAPRAFVVKANVFEGCMH